MRRIVKKRWHELTKEEVYAISELRTEVFLREQACDDAELDWRDLEDETIHLFIPIQHVTNADQMGQLSYSSSSAKIAAYLRILRTDDSAFVASHPWSIGRVVVRSEFRGRGLAAELIQSATSLYDEVLRHPDQSEGMVLHAQVYAHALYEKAGFRSVGDVFDEGGIRHIAMVRS